MRVAEWDVDRVNEYVEKVTMGMLVDAANVVAEKLKGSCPVGTIERPVYKTGKHAGLIWTSRKPGRLRASIRVVRRKTKSGKALSKKLNVRVYVGHFTGYYPYWNEYGSDHGTFKIPARPFFRPAWYQSQAEMCQILGVM